MNRLRGWSAAVGTTLGRGCTPVRIAGTASGVSMATVVASRYHVAPLAKRARFGNDRASRRSPSISVETGSSSRTISTIGVADRDGPVTDAAAPDGSTSSDTGEIAQEEGDEDQRCRRQHGQEAADDGRPHVGEGGACAQRHRDRNRDGRARQEVAERRQQEGGDQQRDQDQQQPAAERGPEPSGRPHRRRAHERRHEAVGEREDDDVEPRVAPGDEELGAVAQQAEQRLHEREPPQAAKVQRRAAEPDGRAGAVCRRVCVGAHGRGDVEAGHPRGRASYSVRVCETGSVRTISKRSASAASKPGLS